MRNEGALLISDRSSWKGRVVERRRVEVLKPTCCQGRLQPKPLVDWHLPFSRARSTKLPAMFWTINRLFAFHSHDPPREHHTAATWGAKKGDDGMKRREKKKKTNGKKGSNKMLSSTLYFSSENRKPALSFRLDGFPPSYSEHALTPVIPFTQIPPPYSTKGRNFRRTLELISK